MKINTSSCQDNKPTVDFLVVDDQELMRRTIRNMLLCIYNQKKTVEMAKNGMEALAVLEKKQVKFLITDWHMPELNGLELLQLIRKNPLFFEIPVLMVADETAEAQIARVVSSCVDGYHTKPFTEKELMDNIQEVLRQRENKTPLDNKISTLKRLRLQKQYDKVIELGRKLLAEDDHPEITYFVGECYYLKQEYQTARDYIKKILDESSGKAAYLYGRICMALGDEEEALKYMQMVSENDPFNLEPKIDVAEAYLSMGRADEAEEVIDSVLSSNPSKLDLTKLGKTFLKHQDLERAGQCLDQAGDPLPEAVPILNNYANKLQQEGKLDESLEQYQKCLQADTDPQAILYNMALLYYKKSDYPKTIKTLQAILEDDPSHEQTNQFLAHVNAKMKD